IGPDNSLYVVSQTNNEVLRYNANTGQFLNTFVTPNSGGLSQPVGMVFGPDNNLYVASQTTNQVLRYNGTTGAFKDVFVSAGLVGLTSPTGITFGPDGNLYVCSNTTWSIMRYQGPLGASPGSALPASGQTRANFVPYRSGGLIEPNRAIFGPDGDLYVIGGQT